MYNSSMGVPYYPTQIATFRNNTPGAGTDHFYFKERRGRVDWRLIAPIDVNRLMRDGDIDVLQSLVETLTFADIESEAQHRYADPEFVKIIRICQLAIEYLLHVQDTLDGERKQLRDNSQSFNDDLLDLNNQLAKSKEETAMLKRDVHNKKKIISNLEMMLKLPASSVRLPDGRVFRCPLCSKIFATCQYLENHVYRRHPEQANSALRKGALAQYQNDNIWQSQLELNKKERDDETAHELRQLRDLKEKLTKETERLSQSERDLRSKLEEQFNQERQTWRKKEDEMEKTQLDQRLRYEEELRNFQSSLRKEFFDHKMHVADQQRKSEKEKEEVRPKSSIGVLESDDEGLNRKTVVESQIKDAVSKVKEDFEKQLKAIQDKAAKEQEQTNLLLQEERRRAAMEKKLAQDEFEREKAKQEREKERERERMQQEKEREKADLDQQQKQKMAKKQQKQKQRDLDLQQQQKEQQLKLQQQQKLEQQKKRQQQLQQRQQEEEERRKQALAKKKQQQQQKQEEIVPFEEPEEEEPEEEEEEEQSLIQLKIPQVAKFTPFPSRPYLKSLFSHTPRDIEAARDEVEAQLEEELRAFGVQPGMGLKKRDRDRLVAQLIEDRENEEEILQDYPIEVQRQMTDELRQQMDDLANQYCQFPEEEDETLYEEQEDPAPNRTPSVSRRNSFVNFPSRPPPSPTPSSPALTRKLSQQLASEAAARKGNLRNSSSNIGTSPNKKSKTQNEYYDDDEIEYQQQMQQQQSLQNLQQMQHEHSDYFDDDGDAYIDEDEEIYDPPQSNKPRPQLQKSTGINKGQGRQQQNKQPIQRQLQMQPIEEFDEDEEDEGTDDLVVSHSNVSNKYSNDMPSSNSNRNINNNNSNNYNNNPNVNPGFRTSTELASFEVSDDDAVDDNLSSLQHLAKRNHPSSSKQVQHHQQQPKQQQQNVTSHYDKDEDFDDDLDDDIYSTPASKPTTSNFASKKDDDEDDLSDFLAEAEDVLSNSKNNRNDRGRDDAVEKSYDDDVNWDDVMEV